MTKTLLLVLGASLAYNGDVAPANVATSVRPEDYGSCALTSLYLVCHLKNMPVDWDTLKTSLGEPSQDKTHSFADISNAARQQGAWPVALHCSREVLPDLPLPAIVQFRHRIESDGIPHLLVLLRVENGQMHLLDAPFPAFAIDIPRFAELWTGNIMVFANDEAEAKRFLAVAEHDWIIKRTLLTIGVAGVLIGAVIFAIRRWSSVTCAIRSLPKMVLHVVALPKTGVVIVSLIVLSFGIGAGIILTSWHRTNVRPKLAFDQSELDFGQVEPGRRTFHIPIANAGRLPAMISGATSTCSCAVARAPSVVAPGERNTIEVEATITPGPRITRVAIESNDPYGPTTITLRWHGTGGLRLSSPRVIGQRTPAEVEFHRAIHLVFPGDKSLPTPELLRCECSSNRVRITAGRVSRRTESGDTSGVWLERELDVKVSPPETPELFEAKCKPYFKYGSDETVRYFMVSVPFVGTPFSPRNSAIAFSAIQPSGLLGQQRVLEVDVTRADEELFLGDLPNWLEAGIEVVGENLHATNLKIVRQPPAPISRHTVLIRSKKRGGDVVPFSIFAFSPPKT